MAANRQMEPVKLGRFVKGELDWIVMKALAKERDRRYETASGFAKDIERFLNHEPVQVGPPSIGYKMRKFVRRNRLQVIGGSLLLLALLAGMAGTTVGLIREAKQRGIAQDNEAKATRAAEEEKKAKEGEAEQRTKAERARDRTREALDAMTSSVTGDSLATQKTITAEQRNFLTEVLTYYKEFAGEKADDQLSRFRTSKAAISVGRIEFELGRAEESIAAYRLALDGFDKLVTEFPSEMFYRVGLAAAITTWDFFLPEWEGCWRRLSNIGKHCWSTRNRYPNFQQFPCSAGIWALVTQIWETHLPRWASGQRPRSTFANPRRLLRS